MGRAFVDAHSTEQEDSADQYQRASPRVSWNTVLLDEITFDSPIFQRRSDLSVGARASPKAAGILKRPRSSGGECNKDTQRARQLHEQKLCRLLDRQVREEEGEEAEDQKPLKVDVGATLNNVWDAIFVSPLLDLVDKLKVTKVAKRDEVNVHEPH